MADFEAYSTEKLLASDEPQLKKILQSYKYQHMPLWKFGIFVGYNALAMVGLYQYGMRLRGQRAEPSLRNRSQYTLTNLCIKGTKHAFVIISLYLSGLAIICHNSITLQHFRKLFEIQSALDSFGLRFDPNYQDHLLFSRMRKFGLSEQLIEEIKAQLEGEKQALIARNGLLPETVSKIKETEQLFKNRASELR